MTVFPLPLDGGCRCGLVRYRVSQAPLFSFACHCTDCQQLTSSAFSLGLAVPAAGFALTHGDPVEWTKVADSGATATQFRCGACGGWTHTATTSSPEAVVVRPTTLDDHRWVRPVGQIFTRSALHWALLDVELSWAAEFKDTSELEATFAAAAIRPGVLA